MELLNRSHLYNKRVKMNSITLSIVIFSFLACGTKHKASTEKSSEKTETQSSEKKASISGTVTQTSSYCGGARPPDFLLEQLAEPKPYPNKKFHLIKGDTNTTAHKIILSFTSDSAGNFSFQLETGTYSILLDEQASPPDAKKYKKQSQSIDEDCYKNWWAQPYYLLEVPPTSQTTTIKGLNFNFHHRCFISSDIPCLHYQGLMPQ